MAFEKTDRKSTLADIAASLEIDPDYLAEIAIFGLCCGQGLKVKAPDGFWRFIPEDGWRFWREV